MSRHDRLSGVLRIVGERGKVEVDDLAGELAVSPATVRRDLDHLAAQQLLTRTRGGAVSANVSYDLPLRYKTARHAPEKSRIAHAVAALAQRGGVIGLNGGTTTTEIARALLARGDLSNGGSGPALTVVTNALNIANELAVRQNIKLVVTGGVARAQSFELTGPLATKVLDQIAIDLLILGVDALDPVAGAFAHNEGEANINQLMVRRSARVVVAADSSKLGRRAFAGICPISAVDVVVTDADIPAELSARFTASGVTVHVV
ncbi:DeoR/GlpR family DNA-binding transcription regulator [Amycolatopsis sp. H20-H5]|uniref:DeoR/GlpR family DNA-binding transcription regulator n=1 Tax=Amycolatopsis sp. H20-H5 TaxID=3046309 RepID=UPI002DB56137|nr:DeoR/GlpR family DNA-binding transcription regulator [Amycolatopsis sp. H20-H5]MEC3977155.1 DeoR/GlpR family DNA-binding transcription regulator [Amycolatopsis sp. H20-H5]